MGTMRVLMLPFKYDHIVNEHYGLRHYIRRAMSQSPWYIAHVFILLPSNLVHSRDTLGHSLACIFTNCHFK